MNELWSGDRAVLYGSTGEYLEPEQVLQGFSNEQREAVRHSLRRLGAHGYIETVEEQIRR